MGYLAERERRAGGRLAEAQRVSADLAALNEDIVRSLPIGMAATDTNGNVLWLNPAGAAILGEEKELDAHGRLAELFDLTKTPPSSGTEGEAVLKRSDSSSVVVSSRLAPLLDGTRTQKRILLAGH